MTWAPVFEWLHLASVEILALLVDVTLKGSLVLFASLALMRLLRATSAARRHLVLLLAILSFLVIPALSVTLPQWAVLPSKPTVDEPAITSATARASTDLSQATVKDRLGRSTIAILDGPWPSRLPRHPGLPMGVVAVWLAGIALIALRTAIGKRQLHRLAARAAPLRGRGWTDLVRLPGWLTVELKCSRAETMPMAWGVLRTHVLLPHGAAAWPVGKRRAVLYHEIAHLVRLDPLTQTVARLACTLFWFNPLLWTAMSRLGAEQDKACDDLATARFGNAPDYAEHVLEVVASVGRNVSVSHLASALAHRSALEHRVRAILDPSLRRDRVLPGVFIMSVCLALSAIAPLSMLAPRASSDEHAAPSGKTTDPKHSESAGHDRMGRSALHLAARGGNVRALIRLLAEGLALEAADDEGRTPLHLAAGNGRIETVAALLDAGSDLSARDLEGRTPLHLAARNGYPDVVGQLLTAGGSAHSVDFEGRTPLESAAATGDARVVSLLQESDSSSAVPED
jgi:beta-lactamase regulating signal transducer with metallopeptidase domain